MRSDSYTADIKKKGVANLRKSRTGGRTVGAQQNL